MGLWAEIEKWRERVLGQIALLEQMESENAEKAGAVRQEDEGQGRRA
jgi:hypothetical protein